MGQGREENKGWSSTRYERGQEMEQDKGWRESEPRDSERKELRSLGGERLQEDHFHTLKTQRTFDKGLWAWVYSSTLPETHMGSWAVPG